VQATIEDKSDDSKDSFYEELEQVFSHLPTYHMKILLGDFNAKLRREDVLKLTTGKESLHEGSNDNGVRVVNFATSKNLVANSTCSCIKTFINACRLLLMGCKRTLWA
jgi:exonuclease III